METRGADHLRIVHINDTYELDNLPALHTCVEAMREGLPPQNLITTCAGDFVAPSLLSSIDQGRGMVTMLNAVPIDYVCFGNHECDIPHPSLLQRIDEFNGVWLNSNMRSFSEANAEQLKPGACPDHQLVRLAGGRTVALVGLCCGGGKDATLYREDAFDGHAARILPVSEAVEDAVARAKAAHPGVDCVVPLTHQDIEDDRLLAARGLRFPCILGGHDHAVFVEEAHGTHIVKAGEDAFNCAVIDLVWDADAPPTAAPPSRVSVRLVPLAQPRRHKGPPLELRHPADAAGLELLKQLQQPAEALKTAVLAVREPGYLSSIGVRQHECTMATLIATAMKEAVNACEVCLINAGAVRAKKEYVDGLVTFADLNAECPFPSQYICVRLEGRALSAAVQQSRRPWRPTDGSEPSETADALHTDDATVVDPQTLAVVRVAGAPLEEGRVYTTLIDSYIMRSTPALKAYADAHPGRVPPDDSGRPALPILVQYFCDCVWRSLVEVDADGEVSVGRLSKLFSEADADGDGEISQEEMLTLLETHLGAQMKGRVSAVLAQQCLNYADLDKNGSVNRAELLKFFRVEAKARVSVSSRRSSSSDAAAPAKVQKVKR